MTAKRHPPIFQSVPADEFTDREEIIGRLIRMIAKEVLFYATQYEDQHIVPEEIAARVNRPLEEVLYVLRQLAFAEMIDVRWE